MDILDVIEQGAATEKRYGESDPLRDAASTLLSILDRLDGFGVVGASPHAERVIGAAMMLDPTVRADGVGRTVVFDIKIASGTLLSRAARKLRDAGNDDSLVGVVLHSLVEGDIHWESNVLDEIIVEGVRVAGHSSVRKHAQRRQESILLAG